jgi:hypothetical protein
LILARLKDAQMEVLAVCPATSSQKVAKKQTGSGRGESGHSDPSAGYVLKGIPEGFGIDAG